MSSQNEMRHMIEGVTSGTLPRRTFIRHGLALGFSMGTLGGILAACSDSVTPTGGETDGGSAGGNGSAAGPITLTLWHQENFPEVISGWGAIFDEFNASQDRIQVEQQANDWQDVYGKLTSAISAGNPPDLAFAIPDHTVTIKQTGAVQPVDDIVAQLRDAHGFIDAYVTPYQYEDHIWAVPAFGLHHVFWYREDMLEAAGLSQAPQDWEQLRAAAEAITSGDSYGIGLPASTHLFTDQNLYDLMIVNGAADLFDSQGNVRFNNPQTVEALQFYKDLYAFSPPDSTGWGLAEPIGSIVNGSAAMIMHMGHVFNFWEESGQDAGLLGAQPIPVPEGGERGNVSYSNGIMVLTDDQSRQEAIAEFLGWLFEPDRMGQWLTAGIPGLFLPVTKDVGEADAFWEQPLISKYRGIVEFAIEDAEYGKLYGFTEGAPNPNIGKISSQNLLSKVVQRVTIDGEDPAAAAQWGQEQMQEAVA